MPAPNSPATNANIIQSKIFGTRFVTLFPPALIQRIECGLLGLLGFPGSWYGGTLISFLHRLFTIDPNLLQTLRLQPLRAHCGVPPTRE